MGENSKIEWTDATWNPVVGCSIKSAGCTNCYAMKQAHRLELMGQEPYRGLTKVVNGKPVWTGIVRLGSERSVLAPLHWKKPRRIFVNSMSDLFHEDMPDEAIDKVFAVMALCPQHTFQILTKRAERMLAYMKSLAVAPERLGCHVDPKDRTTITKVLNRVPLPNVWLGTSVEDQKAADERIPHLLQTPAAKRFLSCEPMLGPVRLDVAPYFDGIHWINWLTGEVHLIEGAYTGHPKPRDYPGLDWVIAGGESGPGARPMHPDWARSLRDQCQAASVPFFMKQMTKKAPIPDDLFVREFPA